jgi:exopolysaccharide production protein ExoQ
MMTTYEEANAQSVYRTPEAPISHLVVTWALMIPLVCFASSGLLWFRGGAGNTALAARFGVLGSGAAATLDNTVVALLLFVTISTLLFPWVKSVVGLFRRDIVFVALAVWPILSCLWSQLPMVSLEWAPVAALEVVFAFYLYRRFSPVRQMQLFLLLGWICLLLSIFLCLFFPNYGIDHTDTAAPWQGMYPHKNLCSMTTAFLLPAALYAPAPGLFSKILRVAYVCLSVFLIVMTQSATGKIVLVCFGAYVIATKVSSRLPSKERTIALIVGVTIALALVAVGVSASEQILLSLGKDSTLTGRTEIWRSIMPSIMKHPFLGYGYRAFWRGYEGESANTSFATHWAVPSAHNAFLEVWLGLGIVGVVLVVYSLLRAMRDAFVCFQGGKSPYLGWCASIVFLTIVMSMDEGELLTPNNLLWILYILACAGLSHGAKRIRFEVNRG